MNVIASSLLDVLTDAAGVATPQSPGADGPPFAAFVALTGGDGQGAPISAPPHAAIPFSLASDTFAAESEIDTGPTPHAADLLEALDGPLFGLFAEPGGAGDRPPASTFVAAAVAPAAPRAIHRDSPANTPSWPPAAPRAIHRDSPANTPSWPPAAPPATAAPGPGNSAPTDNAESVVAGPPRPSSQSAHTSFPSMPPAATTARQLSVVLGDVDAPLLFTGTPGRPKASAPHSGDTGQAVSHRVDPRPAGPVGAAPQPGAASPAGRPTPTAIATTTPERMPSADVARPSAVAKIDNATNPPLTPTKAVDPSGPARLPTRWAESATEPAVVSFIRLPQAKPAQPAVARAPGIAPAVNPTVAVPIAPPPQPAPVLPGFESAGTAAGPVSTNPPATPGFVRDGAPTAPGEPREAKPVPLNAAEVRPEVPVTQRSEPSPAAKADSPPQPDRPAPARPAIVEQVAMQLRAAVSEGVDRISIQLKPASLGAVEVTLDVASHGRVSVLVTAERAETLELLQRDARGLERALQDAGLRTDSGSLSFNLRGEGHHGAARDLAAAFADRDAPDPEPDDAVDAGDADQAPTRATNRILDIEV